MISENVSSLIILAVLVVSMAISYGIIAGVKPKPFRSETDSTKLNQKKSILVSLLVGLICGLVCLGILWGLTKKGSSGMATVAFSYKPYF